jgi:hypothetical protein
MRLAGDSYRLDSDVVLDESLRQVHLRGQVARVMTDSQEQRAALGRLLATFETRDPDDVEDALAAIELSEGDPAIGAALVQLLEAP